MAYRIEYRWESEFLCNDRWFETLLVGSNILTNGPWHHIAVTRTGSSGAIKLYVDGNQQGTGTRKGSFTSAKSKINIGWFNGYGYYNNGV